MRKRYRCFLAYQSQVLAPWTRQDRFLSNTTHRSPFWMVKLSSFPFVKMTTYCSTRGGVAGVSFQTAIIAGHAPDGGLYVPENIPTITSEELQSMRGLTYPQLAEKIIRKFVFEEELSSEELKSKWLHKVTLLGFFFPKRHCGELFFRIPPPRAAHDQAAGQGEPPGAVAWADWCLQGLQSLIHGKDLQCCYEEEQDQGGGACGYPWRYRQCCHTQLQGQRQPGYVLSLDTNLWSLD